MYRLLLRLRIKPTWITPEAPAMPANLGSPASIDEWVLEYTEFQGKRDLLQLKRVKEQSGLAAPASADMAARA